MNPHPADKRIGSRFVRWTSRLEFRSRNEEHSLEKLSGVPRWRCRAGGVGLEVVDGWECSGHQEEPHNNSQQISSNQENQK